jgi:hypothetical protein
MAVIGGEKAQETKLKAERDAEPADRRVAQ